MDGQNVVVQQSITVPSMPETTISNPIAQEGIGVAISGLQFIVLLGFIYTLILRFSIAPSQRRISSS